MITVLNFSSKHADDWLWCRWRDLPSITEIIPPIGKQITLSLSLIIKRHIVHQLALAMVLGVLTKEVSYLQNNDSSPHVSEIFMKFLELFLLWQFRDYRMDVYHLFCLQNVEVVILYTQAWDISEKHTYLRGNWEVALFIHFYWPFASCCKTPQRGTCLTHTEKCQKLADIK